MRLAIIASLLVAAPAAGQNLQNFKPAAGTWNHMATESAETAPRGRFVPSLYVNYGRNPLVRRNSKGEITTAVVEHQAGIDLMATYGVLEIFEVGFHVPMGLVLGDNVSVIGKGGFGLGDVRVLPKVVVASSGKSPTAALAFALPISIPAGEEDKGLGNRSFQLNPTLLGELRFATIKTTLGAGYRYRPENDQLDSVEIGDEITYSGATSFEMGVPELRGIVEVWGVAPVEKTSGPTSPLESAVSARYTSNACWSVTGGVGLGLISDYGVPEARGVMGFAWSCGEVDRDGDGLMDPDDRCPTVKEDLDGFEDTDGCPEFDNDEDGVRDDKDQCPERQEDHDLWADTDGCPELDNDGDGILDRDDACPNAAEDMDGYQDADGCPELDNDNDQVPDEKDLCPFVSEDVDNHRDDDGCPDPDNDDDGVPDASDKCPLQAGTGDGCPKD